MSKHECVLTVGFKPGYYLLEDTILAILYPDCTWDLVMDSYSMKVTRKYSPAIALEVLTDNRGVYLGPL